jgi:hypothetical protein
MSGKRNNVEDFVIVQFEGAGLLGFYEWELDPFPGFARAIFQDQLDRAKDDFLGRTTFDGGATFQAPIDVIWNVDGRSHIFIVPHLSLGRSGQE